ncbi:MAG: hypothetical protein L0177_04505 [Chloroflexi bacterium]|nr:hypothetical protein [Chloroflexota bacterium]
MRIVLLYNAPQQSRYDTLGEGAAVSGVMDSVQAIGEALTARGHAVSLLGLEPPMSRAIISVSDIDADVVFNLFEGFQGRPDTEAAVAEVLEARNRPFTGASSATLALCLDKSRAKRRLMERGVPTASFQLLDSENIQQFSLGFPVIVKPLGEDASHGITQASVVSDAEALKKQVAFVQENYGKPALVETFLTGREFNVSVLGGATPRVLPPSEIVYSEDMPGPKILSYAAKWEPEAPVYKASTPVCPAPVSEEVRREIERLALAVHEAVGSPPYARADLRADSSGNLYVLEANPNPDLCPGMGMALQASVGGMEYSDLIEAILGMAVSQGEAVVSSYAASHAV